MKSLDRSASICWALLCSLFLGVLSPSAAWACACGCGVFDVGTNSVFPTKKGGIVYFEYDTQQQNRNWNGSSSSPADNNEDKKVISDFFSLGFQYMVNRSWGASLQIPYARRSMKMDMMGEVMVHDHSAIGDIRLRGIFAGLSSDMSTGLTFGVKLPTGSDGYEHFEPDMQIGSGSTDLLLGAYHLGTIVPDTSWNYFANTEADLPVIHLPRYVPGSEMNAAAGVVYNGASVGPVKVAPLVQLKGTHRWSDWGELAAANDTGYSRLLLAPGVEFGLSQVRLYADVGFRLYQYTTGEQLVASQFYKVNLAYHF